MAAPRMPQGMPAGFGPPGGPRPQFVRPHPMGANLGQNLDALQQKFGVDPKRWRCIYPCYLNKKKTIAEGRKIAKEFCVEQPHPSDIAEVCKYLGLPFYIELNKKHPRDFFNRSRVRVLLKNEDGTLRRKDVPTRYQLLIALGKMIPKLESRKIRLKRQAEMIEKRKEMIEAKRREIEEKEQAAKMKRQQKQKRKDNKRKPANTRSK